MFEREAMKENERRAKATLAVVDGFRKGEARFIELSVNGRRTAFNINAIDSIDYSVRSVECLSEFYEVDVSVWSGTTQTFILRTSVSVDPTRAVENIRRRVRKAIESDERYHIIEIVTEYAPGRLIAVTPEGDT